MRGKIIEVEVNMESVGGYVTEVVRRLIGLDGTTVGGFYPDIVEDFQLVRSVFVLRVRSEPVRSSIEIPYSLYGGKVSSRDHDLWMGLVLLRAGVGEVYRRVGLARWLLNQVFEGTQPVLLRMV